MTKLNEIYKCNVCGNIVELVHASIGELVCCQKPMVLLEEKTQDVGNEKHVPLIEQTKNGILVKIGSIAHPMEEKHYIEFIEVLLNQKVYRKYLRPGEKPEAEFEISYSGEIIAREYCNIHGLWKNK
ncbi:MAG: desulfoferrodoxin [Candidatus Micrarchaeia archaeon]|jgi:superoxide reductase